MSRAAAILLAAGSAKRMKGAVKDKILTRLAGKAIFSYSLEAFEATAFVNEYLIVCRDEAQKALLQKLFEAQKINKTVTYVLGGRERQDSVSNALCNVSKACRYVFIHDCARPLIYPKALNDLWQCVQKYRACALAHRIVDTLREVPQGADPYRPNLLNSKDRDCLWGMETPQVFEKELIYNAYKQVIAKGLHVTDDTNAASFAHIPIAIVENDLPNPKITQPKDLEYLDFLISKGKLGI